MTTQTATRKPAEDVKVGDILMPFGAPHLVSRIEPYEGTLFPTGSGARIAHCEPGWCITLIPGQWMTVAG